MGCDAEVKRKDRVSLMSSPTEPAAGNFPRFFFFLASCDLARRRARKKKERPLARGWESPSLSLSSPSLSLSIVAWCVRACDPRVTSQRTRAETATAPACARIPRRGRPRTLHSATCTPHTNATKNTENTKSTEMRAPPPTTTNRSSTSFSLLFRSTFTVTASQSLGLRVTRQNVNECKQNALNTLLMMCKLFD